MLFLIAMVVGCAGDDESGSVVGVDFTQGWVEVACYESSDDWIVDMDEPRPMMVWMEDSSGVWRTAGTMQQHSDLRVMVGNSTGSDVVSCRAWVAQ